MKILITDKPLDPPRMHRQSQSVLEGLPQAEIVSYDFADRAGLIAAGQGVVGLLTSFTPLDAETLRALPDLRVISVSATGCGNVDLDEARRLGIMVCNLGEYSTEEVADHTLALLLGLVRRVKQENLAVEHGGWRNPADPYPLLLSEATLGIYGFGHIGRAVARRALAFGMTVLTVARPSVLKAPMPGVEAVSEEELLRRSDIITNHLPQTPETERYFNAALFFRMAKKPVFLNLGRGITVNEGDLAAALDAGQISAAGLDVLSEEHAPAPDHPLLHRDNVILTPHTAFLSGHSMAVIASQPGKNLAACLTGHPEAARFRIV